MCTNNAFFRNALGAVTKTVKKENLALLSPFADVLSELQDDLPGIVVRRCSSLFVVITVVLQSPSCFPVSV